MEFKFLVKYRGAGDRTSIFLLPVYPSFFAADTSNVAAVGYDATYLVEA
ncbi:MAG: hypothetical protein JGK17_23840 [Microcoleus sp. PH2017_10_PVI_O_A]|nr:MULTISPECIES: hypothetical protein [unclassified Microcoleus]MCC3408559.1 hypothetical protein [Microcoleus sp. PH2017_10_PVI_O_A]MCC3462649.1 hypothetical protein [Microcoleus sp. PH2017_11_PCY_U_A]MCC3481073.1 hypothetical protein [Microcoleus sp. PH2017_12_PCY_D_A]MCC3527471.1 hypothetical protein [Microcoleus sp. PH2017_21_RUC_O_A]MCC3539625.1 hypothetical protein [Microcoleus sp. PH2017_22_RUC_O_B]